MSARSLLSEAQAKGLRLVVAESCTGGLLAGAITSPAGASLVFDRGFVTYSNEAKVEILGVGEDTLDAFGAVSEQVAAEMAQGALARSRADIALSITGVAGPGGSDLKPEGRVCFGLATLDGVSAETVEFGPLGRSEVREASVSHGLQLLLKAVQREL